MLLAFLVQPRQRLLQSLQVLRLAGCPLLLDNRFQGVALGTKLVQLRGQLVHLGSGGLQLLREVIAAVVLLGCDEGALGLHRSARRPGPLQLPTQRRRALRDLALHALGLALGAVRGVGVALDLGQNGLHILQLQTLGLKFRAGRLLGLLCPPLSLQRLPHVAARAGAGATARAGAGDGGHLQARLHEALAGGLHGPQRGTGHWRPGRGVHDLHEGGADL
mmetsp:Transcript_82664/g.267610  ORF Transcript_82664/g.267610 Transcript_82664/m.267610 type:complete len:220 (-) Transcript_82664:2108-2767(-)